MTVKILFTSPVLEHPAAGGPQLRIENSIKALSLLGELHILSSAPKAAIGGQVAEDFYKGYCHNYCYTPLASPIIGGSLANKFYRLACRVFIRDAKFIAIYVKKHDIDIIWFGYGNISYDLISKVRELCPDSKMVCDTDSVWSRFILRELPYEKDPARRQKIQRDGEQKEKEEEKLVNLCDVTTAVSEIDAEYYREIAQEPDRIKLFSNVIDLATYQNSPPAPVDFIKPCIYLAGSFAPLSAMDKAARWVIDNIFPLIQKKIPDVHFYIIGKGSKETLADIENANITIAGKLETVLPYLCNANVSLVPLKFESGTRFKILEAGACGVPIVSTTLGAEGIPVTHEKDILIADGPEDFANSIIRLMMDQKLSDNIALNLQELVTQKYSVDYLVDEGKKIIKYLDD